MFLFIGIYSVDLVNDSLYEWSVKLKKWVKLDIIIIKVIKGTKILGERKSMYSRDKDRKNTHNKEHEITKTICTKNKISKWAKRLLGCLEKVKSGADERGKERV